MSSDKVTANLSTKGTPIDWEYPKLIKPFAENVINLFIGNTENHAVIIDVINELLDRVAELENHSSDTSASSELGENNE